MNTGTAIVVSVAVLTAAAVAYMVLSRQQPVSQPMSAPNVAPQVVQVTQGGQRAGANVQNIINTVASGANSVIDLYRSTKELFGGLF